MVKILSVYQLIHVCKGAIRAIMVVYHLEVHHAFAESLVDFGEKHRLFLGVVLVSMDSWSYGGVVFVVLDNCIRLIVGPSGIPLE